MRSHVSIHDFEPQDWAALWPSGNPFVQHAFHAALEDSGCVSADSGWTPQHLGVYRDGSLIAAMPLYRKSHSQGEFVFDWAWAHAYHEHGLEYFPKLLTAIPFTPAEGPRLGVHAGVDLALVATRLLDHIGARLQSEGLSGWHLLFPEPELSTVLRSLAGSPLLERRDVQFHWINRGYSDFDAFLAMLRAGRRKNLRRERRRIDEAGIRVARIAGPDIQDTDWDAFFDCYRHTYLKRSGHAGYLNRDCFERLRRSMADRLLLVMARDGDRPLASALFLHDSERLYGRYWGALEEVDCLHFECCLYQGIEYCIERGLQRFDPGTQGEHKLLRGFEPVETRSFHLVADTRFREAIARYLVQERTAVSRYREDAGAYLPFRRNRHGASGE